MAKKRKKTKARSKSKKKQNKQSLSSKFELKEGARNQIIAILFVLFAVILVASWFTTNSGSNIVADGVRWLVGGGIYVAPFMFGFMSYKIFTHEEHKLPLSASLGSLSSLIILSGIFHLGVEQQYSWEQATAGRGGGATGHLIATMFESLFGTVAIVILVGLLVIAVSVMFNIRPSELFEKFKIRRQKKQKEREEKPQIATQPDVRPTLNSNVPLESKSARQRSSFKNSVKELSSEEAQREALTMSSDPEWNFPAIDLLESKVEKADAGDWKQNVEVINGTLSDFKIDVQMGEVNVGPRVTQYTLVPPSGVRLSKITQLEQNIALNLASSSVRIEAPIPGKRAVGIEVPNQKAATVRLRSIIESREWAKAKSPLAFALGQDISGEAMVGELDAMPHLLIAGQTGAGKSVMINTLLASFLYRNSPSDMKLILVDPKHVELSLYEDIPHLLTPVITETEKTISALKWAVEEMERRLSEFKENGKRNIADYNSMKKKQEGEETMPYIVIVIDELSDLMMVAARDVEALVVRLAQKARATGIHLVLATQRPSVDVITGLIKANIPGRIAFTTQSQVDSRTILDKAGAEKLLGKGDMLYKIPTLPNPKRIQGVFISDEEVNKVVDHLRGESEPDYNDEVISQPVQIGGAGSVMDNIDEADEDLYQEAVTEVVRAGKASTSFLQRKFSIGYNRAARLVDMMEEQGIVGTQKGNRARDVLVNSTEDVFGGPDEADDF